MLMNSSSSTNETLNETLGRELRLYPTYRLPPLCLNLSSSKTPGGSRDTATKHKHMGRAHTVPVPARSCLGAPRPPEGGATAPLRTPLDPPSGALLPRAIERDRFAAPKVSREVCVWLRVNVRFVWGAFSVLCCFACGCLLELVVCRVRFARVSCPRLRFEGR